MLTVLLLLWLLLFPFPAFAHTDGVDHNHDQVVTPTEIPTETPTPTPTPTTSPTQTPTVTPTPTTAPANTSPSNTPVPSPTTKPSLKQSAASQSAGFGGSGLVDEKENESGLGFDDGKVLGSATQDLDSTGDKDLLSTLIFLTGAVILVVWTTYMILIQKGIIKTVPKKDKPKKNFTPLKLK